MPRLLDDIRKGAQLEKPWFIPPAKENAWRNHSRLLWEMLSADDRLPVLTLDAAAEYYFSGTAQEMWDITRDFPNLAPPYAAFWAEYRMPRLIHSDQEGDTNLSQVLPQGGRVGILTYAVDPQDCVGEGIPVRAHRVLWFELFIDYHRPHHAPAGPHGMIFLCVDAEGQALEVPYIQTFADPEHGEQLKNLITFLHPLLLAISSHPWTYVPS